MIYILTTCSRPGNLFLIQTTIPKECKWVIIYDNLVKTKPEIENAITFDGPYTGSWGYPNKNYFISNFMGNFTADDWVYNLDDDNIIHPDWYENLICLGPGC